MKPWKSFDQESIGAQLDMLQWGHGDEAVEESELTGSSSAARDRFNGATAMKPWKRREV